MVYLLIWAMMRWRQERGGLIGPAITLTYPAIFVALIAATLFVGRLRAQVWGDGSQSASDETRKLQWAMAIPKIFSNPMGHGIGQGGKVLGFTNGAGIGTIDSYYLSVLLELGVVGFVVYYSMVLRVAWISARTVILSRQEREIRLLMPISVSLANYVLVKAVLSQEANHPLIFMMLGGAIALIYRSRQGDLGHNGQPPRISGDPTGGLGSQNKSREGRAKKPPKSDLGWLPLIMWIIVGSMLIAVVLTLLRGVF